MPNRQSLIHESVSTRCIGCRFCTAGDCFVPGGTCVYRKIDGVPGHYVGDVLENAGLVKPGWDGFGDVAPTV